MNFAIFLRTPFYRKPLGEYFWYVRLAKIFITDNSIKSLHVLCYLKRYVQDFNLIPFYQMRCD